MACTSDFIDYIGGILSPLGEVKSRKMMGDWIIYLNNKSVITACDNIAYVKKYPCISELMKEAEYGSPYPGAKEAYILDLTDQNKVRKVIALLWDDLPFPKSRKK